LEKEGQGGFVEMIHSKIPPDLPFSKGGSPLFGKEGLGRFSDNVNSVSLSLER
jgi:hypothetical protein